MEQNESAVDVIGCIGTKLMIDMLSEIIYPIAQKMKQKSNPRLSMETKVDMRKDE